MSYKQRLALIVYAAPRTPSFPYGAPKNAAS